MSTELKQSAQASAEWPGRRIDFAEFSARLAARKAELGEIEIPRNSGTLRTASKRALLAEIEKLGGNW